MVKEMTTKRVGRFLYCISPDGKSVSIAYRTLMNPIIGQSMVEVRLDGILEPLSSNKNVVYEGFAYPGIVYRFENIAEEKLVEVLSRRSQN